MTTDQQAILIVTLIAVQIFLFLVYVEKYFRIFLNKHTNLKIKRFKYWLSGQNVAHFWSILWYPEFRNELSDFRNAIREIITTTLAFICLIIYIIITALLPFTLINQILA